MLTLKFLTVEAALLIVSVAASTGLDGTAERVVLYGAAGAALLWFWATLLVPFAKLIRRALNAYEHLEDMPEYLAEAQRANKLTGRRLNRLERWARENRSALIALNRELGVGFRYEPIPEHDADLDEEINS